MTIAPRNATQNILAVLSGFSSGDFYRRVEASEDPTLQPVVEKLNEVAEALQAQAQQRADARTKTDLDLAMLQSLVDNLPVAVFLKDARDQCKVKIWNKAAEEIFQIPRDVMLEKTAHDLWTKEEADLYLAADMKVARGGIIVDIPEEPSHTRSRGMIYLHTLKMPLNPYNNPEIPYVLCICEDVTQRKRSDEALRYKHQLLTEAQQMALLGSWVIELPSFEMTWSEQNYRNFGLSSDHPAPSFEKFLDLLDPADRIAMQEWTRSCLDGENPASHEFRAIRPDGKDGRTIIEFSGRLVVDDQGLPVRLVGTTRDITERKQAEEMMTRTQRLDSLGTMAAGIAHDFNNMLTGLFGYLELIEEKFHGDPSALEFVGKSLSFFDRARDLTRQMLTFAKGGSPVKSAVDLNQLLRETTGFVLSGSKLIVDFQLSPDLPPVDADPNQIKQAMENLLINANQAMPSGGSVTVATHAPARDTVRVTIRDHGVGISPEHLPRIFDPFFTTKDKGHGLGLSMVHSIITRHGGHVEVSSQPGQGSTFVIDLPASKESVSPVPVPVKLSDLRNRRVLVMDDEPALGQLAKAVLDRAGCQSAIVKNGSEAVEAYSVAMKNGEPFDLVILDLTIPGGMGGLETMAALRGIDPGVRAVVSSGYADDPVMSHPADFGFAGSVAKPYRLASFTETLVKAMAPDGGQQ